MIERPPHSVGGPWGMMVGTGIRYAKSGKGTEPRASQLRLIAGKPSA
jgi:hypothetical protein